MEISIRNALNSLNIRIHEYEKERKKKDKLYKFISESERYKESLEEDKERYSFLLSSVKKLYAQDKQNKISYIEDVIKSFISKIWKDRTYDIEIIIEYKNKANHCWISLIDKATGNELDLNQNEGGLMKQVIAFASSIAINTIYGINTIYLDEAFSLCYCENLCLLGELVTDLVNHGFKFYIIQQHSELLDGIPKNLYVVKDITSINGISQVSQINKGG